MSNRRVPLASVPNATNSPHRGGLLATKRARPNSVQADGNASQPPLKKQILDRGNVDFKSPSRPLVYESGDTKVFTRKNNAQPSAFERKLVAAKQASQAATRQKKTVIDSVESVRQWQKHYRKVFPGFVFYFDSVTEETRKRWTKQIVYLGARDERFFSKYITHVVTSRQIPLEVEFPHPVEENQISDGLHTETHTVDPSLLEKNLEQSCQGRSRSKTGLDKRILDADGKKDLSGNVDILFRARQMNMKIWTLDKLQRFICAITDRELPQHGHSTRNNVANKSNAEAELSSVLRNEKLNGQSDPSLGSKDIVPFKGPYIYIYDYHQRTRPIMIREYPKVANKFEGIWPQFRTTPLGKCPFVEEPQEIERDKRQRRAELKYNVKVASAVTAKSNTMAPPPPVGKPVPKYSQSNSRGEIAEGLDSIQRISNFGASTIPYPSFEGHSRAEIAASGIQPSNITSAIRSQMISSTAAASGVKAGTSKEIHELKRKVLEKNNGIYSSAKMSLGAGTSRVPATRSSKLKTTENFGPIPDDSRARPTEPEAQNTRAIVKASNIQRNGRQKKDPKAGYCENCREKYDDFEEVEYSQYPPPSMVLLSNVFVSLAHPYTAAQEIRNDCIKLGRTGLLTPRATTP
ncbi:Cdc7p-Dbf4p kinase complex regulatory subunit [Ophidiomyces ophidiicola]|nr:Cdc7p-Dbf4p kinase complex regulatory subunit [Ophidiomyces ophidiicola]